MKPATELRVYPGPEGWYWAALGADGTPLAQGEGLAGAPAARRVHLLLPAWRVNVLALDLPETARRRPALLAAAAEGHCLAPAESLQVVWLGRDGTGRALLASWDRAWLAATLAELAGRGLTVAAVWPESLLLPWADSAWTLLWRSDGVVARLGTHLGLALDRGKPPAGLQLALAQAATPPTELALYAEPGAPVPDIAAWQQALGRPVVWRGEWDWRRAPWPAGATLLPGGGPARRWRLTPGTPRRLLLAGLALLALHGAGLALDTLSLQREQAWFAADAQRLAARVLPVGAAIDDPAWQVEQRLRAAQVARGEGGDGMFALLAALGRLQPATAPPPLALDYAEGVLSLDYAQAWPSEARQALVALHPVWSARAGGGVRLSLSSTQEAVEHAP